MRKDTRELQVVTAEAKSVSRLSIGDLSRGSCKSGPRIPVVDCRNSSPFNPLTAPTLNRTQGFLSAFAVGLYRRPLADSHARRGWASGRLERSVGEAEYGLKDVAMW